MWFGAVILIVRSVPARSLTGPVNVTITGRGGGGRVPRLAGAPPPRRAQPGNGRREPHFSNRCTHRVHPPRWCKPQALTLCISLIFTLSGAQQTDCETRESRSAEFKTH